jgi:hypothetical protein
MVNFRTRSRKPEGFVYRERRTNDRAVRAWMLKLCQLADIFAADFPDTQKLCRFRWKETRTSPNLDWAQAPMGLPPGSQMTAIALAALEATVRHPRGKFHSRESATPFVADLERIELSRRRA